MITEEQMSLFVGNEFDMKKTFMNGHVSRFFVRAFFAATARLWCVIGRAYFHSNVKENMLTFD